MSIFRGFCLPKIISLSGVVTGFSRCDKLVKIRDFTSVSTDTEVPQKNLT